MAVKDNDYFETKTSFRTMFGGNGDYYFEIWSKDKNDMNKSECIRFAMSGGALSEHTEIKDLIAKLHWEMEKAGFNKYPNEDE